MNEREFCYWLQGLFEVGGAKSLDERQTQIVKDHLALVFKKVTPDRSPITPVPPPSPGVDPAWLRGPMSPLLWEMPPRVTCATSVAQDKPGQRSYTIC